MYFSGNIDDKGYDLSDVKFRTAFAFLGRSDLSSLPEGWTELGNGVRASVQHYYGADGNTLFFETHDRFLDIQYIVEGEEFCGIARRDTLKVRTPYSCADDITFYEEPPLSGRILLLPGDYVILGPEDAHKPRIAAGRRCLIKKIVIKVPV